MKKLEKVTTPKTIKWFASREDIIRFDLSVQRNKVWKKPQKSLLIHSLLYGYPIPPLYSCDKGDGLYWILDGQQRLSSIIDYVNGKYYLDEGTPDVFGEEIAGKYFTDLSDEMQKELRDMNLMIFHYKNINQAEIEELFYRLNNGTPLTRIETTRARGGELLDKLDSHLEMPLFKDRLQMTENSRNRFSDTEVVLQTMMVFDGIDKFKNIGSNEIAQFVKDKRETGLGDSFLEEFNKAIEFVEDASKEFNKKELKMFKKTNVPVIVKVASDVMKDGMDLDKFGALLVEFFVTNYNKDTEYASFVKAGTSNKENVKARINLLKEKMDNQLVMA